MEWLLNEFERNPIRFRCCSISSRSHNLLICLIC